MWNNDVDGSTLGDNSNVSEEAEASQVHAILVAEPCQCSQYYRLSHK